MELGRGMRQCGLPRRACSWRNAFRRGRRGVIKTDGETKTYLQRQHESSRTSRAKSETWKQKRANMRASVCMRVRVRPCGRRGGHFQRTTCATTHLKSRTASPQQTAATEIATWAQSAQAAPPPLRRLTHGARADALLSIQCRPSTPRYGMRVTLLGVSVYLLLLFW